MDIPDIHLDSFRITDIASAADLPETCNAWTNHKIIINIFFIKGNFLFRNGPWSNKAHIPFDDIDKLWQLIETCFTKEISNLCDAGIVF